MRSKRRNFFPLYILYSFELYWHLLLSRCYLDLRKARESRSRNRIIIISKKKALKNARVVRMLRIPISWHTHVGVLIARDYNNGRLLVLRVSERNIVIREANRCNLSASNKFRGAKIQRIQRGNNGISCGRYYPSFPPPLPVGKRERISLERRV